MLPDVMVTDRCRLRPLQSSDEEEVYLYSKDPEWGRYLPVPQPYLREHAQFYIGAQLQADREKSPTWAIVKADVVVGICNLIFDWIQGSAEIGISLAPSVWRQGLAAEVLRHLISTAYCDCAELQRIVGYADRRNQASRALMEGLGFQLEGIARSRRSVRGERVDDAVYSLLRSEASFT